MNALRAILLLLAFLTGAAHAQQYPQYIGPPWALPAGSPFIVGAINGSLVFNCVDASNGPAANPGMVGMACRTTTEENLNPTFVLRGPSYTFEGNNSDAFGIDWMALLTRRGFSVGLPRPCPGGMGPCPGMNLSRWSYPLDKLEVRSVDAGNNFGCNAENHFECAYAGRLDDGNYAYQIGVLPYTFPGGGKGFSIVITNPDGSKVPALLCPRPTVSGQPVCRILTAP